MKSLHKHLHHSPHNKRPTTASKPTGDPHQWVAFPPLPSHAQQTFSSAVQFVSATLKPFSNTTPPTSLPLSPRNSALTPKTPSIPHPHPNSHFKRPRTSTAPFIISRKRSKSDLGLAPTHLSRSPLKLPQKNIHQPRVSFNSSSPSELAFLRDSRRHRVDVHNPILLARNRQRTRTCTFADRTPSATSSRSGKANSASLAPPTSRCSTPTMTHRTRQRAKTLVTPLPPLRPPFLEPRSTYLGGVGEYLNRPEPILQERRASGRTVTPPKLTIDVSVCSPKPTGQGWYNRLLVSPISSASSSMISFFSGTHQNPLPVLSDEELEPNQDQQGASFESWDF